MGRMEQDFIKHSEGPGEKGHLYYYHCYYYGSTADTLFVLEQWGEKGIDGVSHR